MLYPALRDKRSVQRVAKVEEVCCPHTERLQCIRPAAGRSVGRPMQHGGRTLGHNCHTVPPRWCSDYKYTPVAVNGGFPDAADTRRLKETALRNLSAS